MSPPSATSDSKTRTTLSLAVCATCLLLRAVTNRCYSWPPGLRTIIKSARPRVSAWPSSFGWALRNKHLQARYGRAGHNLTSASARVAFVWWNSSNPPADSAIRPAIRTHTERILTRIWSSVTPGCPTTLPHSQPLSPGVRCLTAVCANLDTLSELVVFSRFPGSRPLRWGKEWVPLAAWCLVPSVSSQLHPPAHSCPRSKVPRPVGG